ncbi:MAG: dienelactone hydrolase family protein [Actinomycetota bacterium]
MREYVLQEIATDYSDALITRREAFRRLALLGLGVSAAAAFLAACGGGGGGDDKKSSGGDKPATSAPPETTPAVAEDITFAGPNGDIFGAFAAAPDAQGAVLVIHEIFGLTDHIKSLPPRFTAEGYSALAIDLLSEEGGTAAAGEDALGALAAAPDDRLVADMRAGLDELERREPDVKLAVVGFCFGGGMTWILLAAGEPRLAAAVPFYGPTPANADFSQSEAAVLAIYGELDAGVNAGQDAAVAALEAAGLTHEVRTFPGADHGFFNDTSPRYNAAAAPEAYAAVLAWFGEHLA